MLNIIAVAYERTTPLVGLVSSFLVQSNSNWKLVIIHDGKASDGVHNIINLFPDDRISFLETPERYENYGHPNRKLGLDLLESNSKDWVLLTNDDNYYIPKFVEFTSKACTGNTGLIYWNTIHSHQDYNLHYSTIVECGIDMGAFIVRNDVAKAVGFPWTHYSADGTYAVECKKYCNKNNLRIHYINKFMFVHN